MSMSGPGMWMPKQKEGKNWEVIYSGKINGEDFSQSRKFRIRADAQDFINDSKPLFARDERVSDVSFKIGSI